MAITPLPTPPSRDDPTNFSTRADAFLGALPDFATEANALAVQVNDDAATAAAAAAMVDAPKWVSGTTYAEGFIVWSPITYLAYRRKTAGAGTTDPSSDTTNWAQAAGTGDVSQTGTQTLTNKTLTSPVTTNEKLTTVREAITVSATAATGTINYDSLTQSVLYYTTNASSNWTVNFRGNGSTSLNTMMATGESLTVAFLVTQGATAYYNSAVQVDGSSVTAKWQGGTAPMAGNASGIDVYTYTIIKTGDATFTVLASQSQFK